jgi:hypothetical protein
MCRPSSSNHQPSMLASYSKCSTTSPLIPPYSLLPHFPLPFSWPLPPAFPRSTVSRGQKSQARIKTPSSFGFLSKAEALMLRQSKTLQEPSLGRIKYAVENKQMLIEPTRRRDAEAGAKTMTRNVFEVLACIGGTTAGPDVASIVHGRRAAASSWRSPHSRPSGDPNVTG